MAAPLLRRQFVFGAAALMVISQILFRAWALYPSWFFADDYRLLLDAGAAAAPGPAYLFSPFDSQLMPGGRLLVWLVAVAGTTNWGLAASLTLLLQLVASCACLWMLVTLFGPRPATLGLLAIYLTSAIGMPALMWWAAALNQIPLQISFFCTVAAAVRYLRKPGIGWLAVTAAAFSFGLLFYVKTVLLAPLLLFVAVAYFTTGTPRARLRQVLRRYWPAVVAASAAGVAYTFYYLAFVPQAFVEQQGVAKVGEVANAMLGTALPTGAVGGPWRWFDTSPPIVLASPPSWTVHLAWIAIALAVAYSLLRRVRAWGGWVVMLGYALLLFLLLLTTRGQQYGGFAGLEYRYLTDMVCVMPLGLGLVFLELAGAPRSSAPRVDPPLRRGLDTRAVAVLVAMVCIGGLVSSVQYIVFWHRENAGHAYVKSVQAAMRQANGGVDLPSQLVPAEVMPSYTAPDNDTEQFVPLVAAGARFPESTGRLQVLDTGGQLSQASITPGPRSPPGPVPDCGYQLQDSPASIPLDSGTFEFSWWVRIGYLASADSPVTVQTGSEVIHARLNRGLHSLYLHTEAEFTSVRLSGLAAGTTVCVDTVEVGQPVPALEAP